MGTYATAEIFYGIPIYADEEDFENSMQDFVDKKLEEDEDFEIDDYLYNLKETEGCSIGVASHLGNYSTYYAQANGSAQRSGVGEMQDLNIIPLENTAKWDNALKKFCEENSLPYEQPKWYLTADYG